MLCIEEEEDEDEEDEDEDEDEGVSQICEWRFV